MTSNARPAPDAERWMAATPMIRRSILASLLSLLGTTLALPAPSEPAGGFDITVKVPPIMRGPADSKDMNACFPGTADSPWRNAGSAGTSAVKRVTFGAVTAEEVRTRSKQDVASLQTSCSGVVFQEAR